MMKMLWMIVVKKEEEKKTRIRAEQSSSYIWFPCGAAWHEREGEREKGYKYK